MRNKKRRTEQKENKLDLHGVPHNEVKSKVIRKVEEHWGTDIEVEFVTGNSERMKSLVKEVLDEYQLNYIDGSFFNDGVIKSRI